MIRLLHIAFACFMAVAIAMWGPWEHIFIVLQPLTTTLSIVMAAIFVRLNRGMPTLDWKSIPLDKRKKLSQAVYEVSKEYLGVLVLSGVSLCTVLVLTGAGITTFICWPAWVRTFAGVALGFSLALTVTRMAYVVWRDLDIVLLQKTIVDELVTAPTRPVPPEEVERSRDLHKSMKSAALSGGKVPVRRGWGSDKTDSME